MNLNTMMIEAKLPAARIFRHMRIEAGMTTRQLSLLMGCANSLVTHYETGRNKLPPERKKQLCKIFKISINELEDYCTGRLPIPINYRDECILMISKMDNIKLQSVYGILSSLSA